MTEEEAKTKWRPYSRLEARQVEYGGYIAKEVNTGRCIGSACMAWRFESDTRKELHGYCGLAGKP